MSMKGRGPEKGVVVWVTNTLIGNYKMWTMTALAISACLMGFQF